MAADFADILGQGEALPDAGRDGLAAPPGAEDAAAEGAQATAGRPGTPATDAEMPAALMAPSAARNEAPVAGMPGAAGVSAVTAAGLRTEAPASAARPVQPARIQPATAATGPVASNPAAPPDPLSPDPAPPGTSAGAESRHGAEARPLADRSDGLLRRVPSADGARTGLPVAPEPSAFPKAPGTQDLPEKGARAAARSTAQAGVPAGVTASPGVAARPDTAPAGLVATPAAAVAAPNPPPAPILTGEALQQLFPLAGTVDAGVRAGASAVPVAAGHPVAAPAPDTGAYVIRQMTDGLGRAVPGGAGALDLALAPAELGRVRMVLAASDAGLTIQIAAERPETADLLRRHADDLLRELRAAGHGQVTLDFGNRHEHPPRPAPEIAPTAGDDGPAPAAAPPLAAPAMRLIVAEGRLDLRI